MKRQRYAFSHSRPAASGAKLPFGHVCVCDENGHATLGAEATAFGSDATGLVGPRCHRRAETQETRKTTSSARMPDLTRLERRGTPLVLHQPGVKVQKLASKIARLASERPSSAERSSTLN